MKHKYLVNIFAAASLLLTSGLLSASDEKARIITQQKLVSQCISPIAINSIDDRLVNVSPLGFDLEPGDHKLMGATTINVGACPRPRGRRTHGISALEANFEAGKDYYVGVDSSSKNSEDWAVVIWKVEDSPGSSD